MGNSRKINTGVNYTMGWVEYKNEKSIMNSMLSRIEELDVNSLNNLQSELDDEFIKTMNLQYKNYFKIIYNSFFRLGIFKDYQSMELDLDSFTSKVGKKIVISEKLKTNTIDEVINYLYGIKLGGNWESLKDYNKEKMDVQVREWRLEVPFSNRIKKCCKFYTK